MILRALSTAVDINSAADDVDSATLVSVVNTNTVPVLVTNSNSNEIYIAAGERVVIEKESSETLDATTGAASVWASKVAYKN